MKKINKFLLLVVIMVFASILYSSISAKEVVFSYTPANQLSNLTENDTKPYFTTSKALIINEFETPNGLVMKRGELHNEKNITQSYNVSIKFGSKEFYLTLNVLPNKTWTYAILDGILILPSPSEGDAIIDPLHTSYYSLGNELSLGFVGNVSKMKIYFMDDKMPSIVYTSVDNKWFYDAKNRMLLIESDDGYFKNIILYFTKFSPRGTIIIEDTRNIEDLRHTIYKTENLLPELYEKVNELNVTFQNIGSEIKEIQNRTNNVITEKKELENRLEIEEISKKEFEEKITGKIVAPPFVFVFAIIGIIILLIIIIDFMILSKKGGKK